MSTDDPHTIEGQEATVAMVDGPTIVLRPTVTSQVTTPDLQHEFPGVTQHHYRPADVGNDVVLYVGAFRRGDGTDTLDGSVRWRWSNNARIEARVTRLATTAAWQQLMSTGDASLWLEHDHLVVDLPGGTLPPQPAEGTRPENAGRVIASRLEQQLGDGQDLDRVTFLIPNGWQAFDGSAVCDPHDLARQWHGRLTATGGGWAVTIDPTGEMDPAAWHELKDRASYSFTHVGCLTRSDRSPFTGEEALHALDRVRVALNVALGRRTTCSLPVGWRDDAPVWAGWRSAPVDPFQPIRHWLDDTIATRQITNIVERVLDFTADLAAWEALRPAAAYYVAANMDVDVEMPVAIPVSGLQLLAYYRFVTDRGAYSRSKWKALGTEAQLRLLLDDINLDLSVQSQFMHLAAVQQRLAQHRARWDALGVVVKMRNLVTHPKKDEPALFSAREWAEAGMHARFWLCMALLNVVGYDDEVAAVMGAEPQGTGQVRPPPWTQARNDHER